MKRYLDKLLQSRKRKEVNNFKQKWDKRTSCLWIILPAWNIIFKFALAGIGKQLWWFWCGYINNPCFYSDVLD